MRVVTPVTHQCLRSLHGAFWGARGGLGWLGLWGPGGFREVAVDLPVETYFNIVTGSAAQLKVSPARLS